MPLVIDEEYLPATLTAQPMTDAEFADFCAQHPGYAIEMTAEGEIIIMPANYSLTAARCGEIARQLGNWNVSFGRGIMTDSSGGFVLPNRARRSPDAGWVAGSRVTGPASIKLAGFWHLAPDFVIELRSETDRLPTLRRKMHEWIDNGTLLAWLVDPERRTVEIYRPNLEPEIITGIEQVTGEGLVDSFTLDLRPVWDPMHALGKDS